METCTRPRWRWIISYFGEGTCWGRWTRRLRAFWQGYASSMSAVDVGSISWHQKIQKEVIKKLENPADAVMDVSSDEDIDEEIEDLERIKSASNALQWWIKSYGSLINLIIRTCQSIVKIIKSLLARPPHFQKTADKTNKILYKEINSHVEINQFFFYCELFICYREL